ncbi:hypothetical protein L2199_22360, partial [Xanthomonas perforans]|nr:hypothetical protein [Xanthomonas perforans]
TCPFLIGPSPKTHWNISRKVALAPRPACMSSALPFARAHRCCTSPGRALHRHASLPASVNDASYNKR